MGDLECAFINCMIMVSYIVAAYGKFIVSGTNYTHCTTHARACTFGYCFTFITVDTNMFNQ